MRRAVICCLLFLGVCAATAAPALARPVCTPSGAGQLRCTIREVDDCEEITGYPYHRNLFCPAAFEAAQEMVSRLRKTLGVKPTRGFFHYFQTLADPEAPPDAQAQTTTACLKTPAPYPKGSHLVIGGGLPLCHLAGYVTSPGPVPSDENDHSSSPIPETLRGYPDYFSKLYAPKASFPLTKFRTGSIFDPIVEGLGSAGRDAFIADDPRFSPESIYDPDQWRQEPQYNGISGGGGGGWGGEIAILGADGRPLTLLAFGGGGGGGMTSSRNPRPGLPISVLGAGGGGGMQFGNAYRVVRQSYNGLGLGAGMGSDEPRVEYSYNDYAGSGNPPLPVHQYNPAVIAEYQAQLANLEQQLQSRLKAGRTIVLMGGGGMGAGTEYLKANGQEFEPHALSTQAGFQFSYEFEDAKNASNLGEPAVLASLQAEQESFYTLLGDDYRTASRRAYDACDQDYSNYKCICPRTHAIVICLVGRQIKDSAKIPSWLQEQHCPASTVSTPANGLTGYQQLLVDSASAVDPPCSDVLLNYFGRMNSPVTTQY